MYIIRLIAVALVLLSMVSAYDSGPFNVTFDLPRHMQIFNESKQSETLSGTNYTHSRLYSADDEFIMAITEFENVTMFDLDMKKKLPGCDILNSAKRDVDGGRADVTNAICGDVNVFHVTWWHDNSTLVEIASAMPWDRGTLQMLKTIHIRRLNETTIPD